MNIRKIKKYSYDVAMDSLYYFCNHKGLVKRSPYVDLYFLKKYSPRIEDVDAAIEGIRYWVNMVRYYNVSLVEVDHACIVYDNCIQGHCMSPKGLLTNVGRY